MNSGLSRHSNHARLHGRGSAPGSSPGPEKDAALAIVLVGLLRSARAGPPRCSSYARDPPSRHHRRGQGPTRPPGRSARRTASNTQSPPRRRLPASSAGAAGSRSEPEPSAPSSARGTQRYRTDATPFAGRNASRRPDTGAQPTITSLEPEIEWGGKGQTAGVRWRRAGLRCRPAPP